MTRELPHQGWIENGVHHLPIRIYYQDTDVSGIVYHAQYLHFFERARTEFLRCIGIMQDTLDRDNPETYAAFAVRDMQLDFLRPAQLDDALIIATQLVGLTGASCRITQQVRRAKDILVTASLRIVFLSVDLRPKRVPEHMRRLLRATMAGHEPQLS
ncbi:MAG: tol-pal system-associated acyl-CoA thioesterase [Pseudomonadota bacterium]